MQALYFALEPARRYRHQRRLCRAAMAEHPQRHPPDRRRAAALCARFRRRLAPRSRQAVRDLRCPHARHLPVDPLQPDRVDGNARGDAAPCSISAAAPASGSSRTRSMAGSISTMCGALDPAGRRGWRQGPVRQQLLEGLGDDRLARRLADAPFGDSRPDWRDDPVCQQRHLWRRSRPARSPPSGRASRWSRRSGSASRPGSTSPMTGWRQIPGIVLPSKPRGGMYAFFALEGESDARRACADILEKARVGLAPGHLFGRSATRSCACASAGTAQQIADRARPHG